MFLKNIFDRHLNVMKKTFETNQIFTEYQDKRYYPKFRVKHEDDTKMVYVFDLLTGFQYKKLEGLQDTLSKTFNQSCVVEVETKLMAVYVYKKELQQFNFQNNMTRSEYEFFLGITDEFEPLFHNFEEIPHMLVAGSTGMGKTNILKLLFHNILTQNPNSAQFYFIDLKGGLEFAKYSNLIQVKEIAKDVTETKELLEKLDSLMMDRMDDMFQKGITNLSHTENKERIFVIVDEAASLTPDNSSMYKKELQICQTKLANIARIGRASGIRLILGTQYPMSNAIGPQLKATIDAKVGFRLQSEYQSRVVIDEAGLESLPLTSGRGVYKTNKKVTFQAPYISDEQIWEDVKRYEVIEEVNKNEAEREGDEDITFHF